jgi:hypothetical protein
MGETVPVGGMLEAAVDGTMAVAPPFGFKVSGKEARPAAASPVGSRRGPFWPQADSSARRAIAARRRRAPALTRIWTLNIWKL